MARETGWDLVLGLAGLVYLAMVLFTGTHMPVVGLVFLILAGHALIRPHLPRHH